MTSLSSKVSPALFIQRGRKAVWNIVPERKPRFSFDLLADDELSCIEVFVLTLHTVAPS